MKGRYVLVITGIIFFVALCYGIYNKKFYKDFNLEEEPLNNFVVALVDEELLDIQLSIMKEELDSSNIIIAAKCEDTFKYRFSSNTQEVSIEYVFKGDGLNEGDKIEIARNGTHIYMEKDGFIAGMPSNDLGFVNEMVPGKIYLIFLDRKLNTFNEEKIYIQVDDLIVAPIFCYEDIPNMPCISIDEIGNYAKYETVKENEFFITSEKGIEKMEAFKEQLISKYSY
ncbi:MAG: hypothetical protein IJA32_16850 [Lachnospiraceae bacterium]|nr:hypothetical protein [Lachnospiraceae bacterium]